MLSSFDLITFSVSLLWERGWGYTRERKTIFEPNTLFHNVWFDVYAKHTSMTAENNKLSFIVFFVCLFTFQRNWLAARPRSCNVPSSVSHQAPQTNGQGTGRAHGETIQQDCLEHTVSTTVAPVCTDVSSGVVARTRWLSIHVSYLSYHKAILTRISCTVMNSLIFLSKLLKKQILTLLLNTELH